VDEVKKRRFLWGVVLAGSPVIPTLLGLGTLFRGISEQKATGLGVVSGGLAELFFMYGMAALVVGQVSAIFLLFRAFSPGNWRRSFFSGLAICFSGFMLLLVGLFVWLAWFQANHNF
jgi:hypothetical protein